MTPLVRSVVERGPWIGYAVLALAYLALVQRDMATTPFRSEAVVNFLLAAIVLATAALLLAIADAQVRRRTLTPRLRRLLFWVPRTVALLFVALLAALAADVFDHGYGPAELALALLIHLVPALVMLGAVALAWRWEWVGAALFAAWSVFWLFMYTGGGDAAPSTWVLIIGFPLLIAALFLLGWQDRRAGLADR
jgi:hypothetical protein